MMKEREKMAKSEQASLLQFEKSQKIKRLNNLAEYNKVKIQRQISAKQEKIEKFKVLKNNIIEESKMKRKIIKIEKSYINNVFDSILNKKDLSVRF